MTRQGNAPLVSGSGLNSCPLYLVITSQGALDASNTTLPEPLNRATLRTARVQGCNPKLIPGYNPPGRP